LKADGGSLAGLSFVPPMLQVRIPADSGKIGPAEAG